MNSERHSGVVTLLFIDVVGSTALKQTLGDHAGLTLFKRITSWSGKSYGLWRAQTARTLTEANICAAGAKDR